MLLLATLSYCPVIGLQRCTMASVDLVAKKAPETAWFLPSALPPNNTFGCADSSTIDMVACYLYYARLIMVFKATLLFCVLHRVETRGLSCANFSSFAAQKQILGSCRLGSLRFVTATCRIHDGLYAGACRFMASP